jgi:hypothetical protein
MLISSYLFLHYLIIYSINYCAISDPEPCSGILIPLYKKYPLPVDYHHHQVESINIIQQTPPSLSLYRKRSTYYHHRHHRIDETNISK